MASNLPVDFNDLPQVLDFTLRQGDTLELPLLLKMNGAAQDLTSCTVTVAVKGLSGTAQTLSRATVPPDVAANGTFTVRLTEADTATWSGVYLYEVQVVWPVGDSALPAGATRTVLAGRLTVTEDIAA
jgi:hypothetical protein